MKYELHSSPKILLVYYFDGDHLYRSTTTVKIPNKEIKENMNYYCRLYINRINWHDRVMLIREVSTNSSSKPNSYLEIVTLKLLFLEKIQKYIWISEQTIQLI